MTMRDTKALARALVADRYCEVRVAQLLNSFVLELRRDFPPDEIRWKFIRLRDMLLPDTAELFRIATETECPPAPNSSLPPRSR